MRFLVEASERFDDFMQAKSYLESKRYKKSYDDLNDSQRHNFVIDAINLMQNKNVLNKAKTSVINALKSSRFGESNEDVITYLNDIGNFNVNDDIVSTITQLISNGNIDYERDKDWLLDKSLYDRNITDVSYAIKVLTLANNPKLQGEYFDDKLTIDDFKEDGKIVSVEKMRDILDGRQTKDYYGKLSGEDIVADALDTDEPTIEDVKKYIKDLYTSKKKLTQTIENVLNSDELDDTLENLLNTNYANDNKSSAQDKFHNAIDKVISKQSDGTEKTTKSNEKGTTGEEILINALKEKNIEPNKDSVIEYIKELFEGNNRKTIISNALEQGILDDEINKVLKTKYQGTLISNPIELFNSAMVKALTDAVNN